MATLDEIRLEQLLSPFENQNIGITNTKAASPFINTTGILNQYNVPNSRNQNLVDAIIAQNMQKNVGNFINVPQDYYPSNLGFINAPQNYYPTNTGGITEIKNQMIEELPPKSLGIDTSYGVANTPNVIGEQSGLNVYESDDGRAYYIDSDTGRKILAPSTVEAYKKRSGYYGKEPSGIAKLFEFLGNIPTPFNLVRRGLESLQGLNRKIRGTTFALSPTLKDYVQAKKAEKRAAAGADIGVGPGGSGSRRGDADIASRDRGSFRTDDTAGFF